MAIRTQPSIVPVADLLYGVTALQLEFHERSSSAQSDFASAWLHGGVKEIGIFNPRYSSTTKGIGVTPDGKPLRITITVETI